MVRVSSPAKLRPWSESTAKMVMGVVPGLVSKGKKGSQVDVGKSQSEMKSQIWPITAAHLVAQCSATPTTVAATPPCSATPFRTQVSVRHLPGQGGARCDTKMFRGCSATPVLHLQNAIKSRKSAATRVARHV